jgi:hypothetical protein
MPSVRAVVMKQSKKPRYGIAPSALGAMFCSRVLTTSNGLLLSAAAPPATKLARPCVAGASGKKPSSAALARS